MKNTTERPRTKIEFNWAKPPMNIVLVEPEIPPNTGNIARLCAATGTRLHLIEPLGFQIDDKAMRRAGLDYWDSVDVSVHANFDAFLEAEKPERFFFSAHQAQKKLQRRKFQGRRFLHFRTRKQRASLELLAKYPEQILNIPMQLEYVRSLNLSNCASIVLYESLRQINQ